MGGAGGRERERERVRRRLVYGTTSVAILAQASGAFFFLVAPSLCKMVSMGWSSGVSKHTPRHELRIGGISPAAAALPDDDLGFRGCTGADDRCDKWTIAPEFGLVHRTVHERPLEAPCLLCLMLADSHGELVPSACG